MIDKSAKDSKFKDKQGRWHTQAIFHECYKNIKGVKPFYTLREKEYKGLPSLKQIYLELEDPTGYRIATEYLGGWLHWKKLCSLGWFKEHLQAWEEELEVKMKCQGISKLVEISQGTNPTAKDAAKFIINREWETKRGRPTKEEKTRQLKINEKVNSTLDNDFNLLKLNEK